MTHMTAIQFAVLAAGYMLAFVRLANAAKFFWMWMPKWLQVTMPGLLAAFPMFAAEIEKSRTWMDVACNILMVMGAVGTAWKGVEHKEEPTV